MADAPPTGTELQSLLVAMLAGELGGSDARWHDLVRVAVRPIPARPSSNWSVNPRGSRNEVVAIDRAVERVRQQHPFARLG